MYIWSLLSALDKYMYIYIHIYIYIYIYIYAYIYTYIHTWLHTCAACCQTAIHSWEQGSCQGCGRRQGGRYWRVCVCVCVCVCCVDMHAIDVGMCKIQTPIGRSVLMCICILCVCVYIYIYSACMYMHAVYACVYTWDVISDQGLVLWCLCHIWIDECTRLTSMISDPSILAVQMAICTTHVPLFADCWKLAIKCLLHMQTNNAQIWHWHMCTFLVQIAKAIKYASIKHATHTCIQIKLDLTYMTLTHVHWLCRLLRQSGNVVQIAEAIRQSSMPQSSMPHAHAYKSCSNSIVRHW
jgi:hypothetical protein